MSTTSFRILRAILAAGALLLAAAAPAGACALALILALDVSASISSRDYDLQREGRARALAEPEVQQAIRAQGGIWFSAFEWSCARHQYDWLD
jgi:Ca-activated chloride channel homolog